ncbi:S9 family peptidase [Taibaiella koreensis]|uniref:S9 family peptidase n=1 Tax=Taibaiella koreensis TaxID=1268548 RepID=UPI000E5A0B43|nr:S9 family peptidase [Taibaiella koreensis]
MRALILAGAAALFFSSCQNTTAVHKEPYQWPSVQPPVAEKKPKDVGMFGDKRIDDYYWMGDYFFKGPDSTKVVDYLKGENAYTDTMMAGTRDFQEKLFNEMKGRIKEKDESVPVFKNGYFYYTRFEEGQQYYIACRKKGAMDAPEEILLNVNELAKGHAYYAIGGTAVSPDNKLLLYGVDTVSRRQYTLHVKNLETGALYTDVIPNTEGYGVWANDNRTIYYVAKHPVTLLSEKIMRHTLGNTAPDELVYEEKDKSNYINVDKSKSERYIFITSEATISSEVRYAEADAPRPVFKVFAPRMKDVLYDVSHQGDRFLVRTNKDAQNFRLMETSLDQTDVSHWKELIPHRKDVLLEDVEPFRNFLVISERKGGLAQLNIRNLKNNDSHYLDFGEPAYTAYASANPEYNSEVLRYGYTSLTTPSSTFDYDMNTRQKKLLKQQEVVGGYDKTQYVTERLMATAKDGTKVPISIVYKKGFKKDGSQPLLLYGYGSYGNSEDATFNSGRLSLLDRGFAYAIAHVRGGQEMGRQWYEDGKLMKKINTFTDFIDCAEYLIAQGYTAKEHLYANGGSAGGLLMGSVVNMRPDLFNGVVADVPFVDVVTTMLDESIPLTTNEFDEWGNPKDKAAYDYMKSYSPVDNVTRRDYPNLLVTTGLHDSQVQYFEPAKWVAKLRVNNTGKHVIMLKTNMDFGHGGASGRFDYLKDVALRYAFYCALEGIIEKQ